MTRIEMVDTGVIYINRNPGYRYNFACHSDLVQVGPQGRLQACH